MSPFNEHALKCGAEVEPSSLSPADVTIRHHGLSEVLVALHEPLPAPLISHVPDMELPETEPE